MLTVTPRIILDSLDSLPGDIRRGAARFRGEIAGEGETILRAEVPKRSKALSEGVKSEIVGERVNLIIEVGEAQPATEGTVIYPSGATKRVTLRALRAFNYADVVDEGVKGPITPRRAKALLIEVETAPSGESYVIARGRTFVIRRSARGQEPNRYSERVVRWILAHIPQFIRRAFELEGL